MLILLAHELARPHRADDILRGEGRARVPLGLVRLEGERVDLERPKLVENFLSPDCNGAGEGFATPGKPGWWLPASL
jgi:hypothetical protein